MASCRRAIDALCNVFVSTVPATPVVFEQNGTAHENYLTVRDFHCHQVYLSFLFLFINSCILTSDMLLQGLKILLGGYEG